MTPGGAAPAHRPDRPGEPGPPWPARPCSPCSARCSACSRARGSTTGSWVTSTASTAVSNVPGPDRPLSFAGAEIAAIVPVSVGESGNVTVSFLALSYAGVLTVTVIADRDAVPELADLVGMLQAELDALTGAPEARRA